MNTLPATIEFGETDLSIIERNGTPWLASADLARALGYADPKRVTMLYNRHKDEFSKEMTEVLNLGTSGNLQKTVRIFSPRGCHLVAMLSKTKLAKDFRRWVLDVLDHLAVRPSSGMTAEQTGAIYHAAQRRVHQLPKAAQKGGFPQIYGALKAHFQVASYKDIPPAHFDAALAFIKSYYFPAVTAEIEGRTFADLPDGLFVLGVENGSPLFLRSLREENIALAVAKLETEMYGFQDRLRSLSIRLGFDFAKRKHCGERDFLMREA